MVLVDSKKCIGCGKCASDCVAKNIEIIDGMAVVKSNCLQCGHCVAICNYDAVCIPDYDMDDVETIDSSKKIDSKLLLYSIKARRSIRDFSSETISEDKLRLLAEAGRYTATANNGQFHKYIFVQDKLDELKNMIWDYIENPEVDAESKSIDWEPYKIFAERRKNNSSDDFLFRNAPTVLFITSSRYLDAGMAAQNIEMMANTMGIGAMFNGFLVRISDANRNLKKWLGIEDETICACMLLGYPKKTYVRTAPRKKAEITIL